MQKIYRKISQKIADAGTNRARPQRPNTMRMNPPSTGPILIRKTAKPAARLVLTAGLAAGAFPMRALLRQPSMANVTSSRTTKITRSKSTLTRSAQNESLRGGSTRNATAPEGSRLGSMENPAGASASGSARTLPAPDKAETGRVQRDAMTPAQRVGGTRALFEYHRDDNTPDHLTTVQIDAARQAIAPVNPNVFGNFIEHLGGVVYEALWAQLLLNPNLERIEPKDAAPAEWQLSGGAGWQTGGLNSERCIRLAPIRGANGLKTPAANDGTGANGFMRSVRSTAAARPALLQTSGASGGMGGAAGMNCGRQTASGPMDQKGVLPAVLSCLSQSVSLPAQRVTRYALNVAVRAPMGAGKVRIALVREPVVTGRRGDRIGQTAAAVRPVQDGTQIVVDVQGAAWQTRRGQFVVPKSLNPDNNLWRFVVQHEGGQAVDVDQITLTPTDNVDGFDPDVLGRTRVWDVPLLRWPGGNFASGYHWQDGVGPRDKRPTRRNPAWGGVEPNHVGTHEFMTFAHLTGATPQLTVNAGDGTPDEAAAWVRYCNAPASDRWGKRRAQNGAAKPFGVKVWEVGNELYGGWQIGHAQAQENATRFVRFRDAMLGADPNLQLIATGKGDEFTPGGLARDEAWNGALLAASTQNGGQAPDWISMHPLVPLPDYARGATYDEQLESALAHPAFLDNTQIPAVAKQITDAEGANPRTRIAITEWGIIVGGPTWRQSPNHDSLAGAIYNALALNAMLRNSDWVTLANMTALLHGGGIKKWHGVTYVDPQYYTQQLYTLAHPHTPVATTTTGPGNDVPARVSMPAVSDVPDVDVFAARSADGGRLTVFAVNRHSAESRPMRLQVNNFRARGIKAMLLTSNDPRDRNSLEAPDAVHPRPLAVPAWTGHANDDWQIALPPHSLVVLTLEGK